MKAWVYKQTGEPKDILKLEQDWPKPEAKKGQVLVKVHAASLNPVGWKAMSMIPIKWMQKTPSVPEHDFSGVIEGGDLSGTNLTVGDSVFGIVPAESVMKSGKGVLAEYTVAEKDLIVKKPENVSYEEASSFPLTTLTSYWALTRTGGLTKGGGQRVFINGGSGGVGAYAVQLAKAYGAYVVTTCSPPSRGLVETLGADEIIDYKSGDLVEKLASQFSIKEKPFDIIFDTVGFNSELYNQSAKYLAPKGTFIDIAGPHFSGSFTSLLSAAGTFAARLALPSFLGGVPRKYVFGMFKPGEGELREIGEFVGEGKLKPIIDEVFPFEQALRAYDRQKSGRAKGKVVVSVVE
ncbi:hypothetical protein JCM6882_009277 [Rhodosporidiobolus microsporus]